TFEAYSKNFTGIATLVLRRPRAALKEFEAAQAIFHSCEDRRGEAMTLANVGRALLELGDLEGARARLSDALTGLRAAGDRTHEAEALQHLARAERALGRPEVAREHLEAAIRITESLRGSIPGVGERAAYMSRNRERYDLLIDVLMELHAKQPDHGWNAEA